MHGPLNVESVSVTSRYNLTASSEKEHKNISKDQPMPFIVMDIISSQSGPQHALAAHVAFFRVVRTRIQMSLIMS